MDADLNPPDLAPPAQLRFDRPGVVQRKGHELPDVTGAGVDSVQPRLVGRDEVVLGRRRKGSRRAAAVDGVHAAHRDLDGVRSPPRPAEREPYGLALMKRDGEAAAPSQRSRSLRF
jgi:hypothetical protein